MSHTMFAPIHNGVMGSIPNRSGLMELVLLLGVIGALILLDVLALRFGADSRIFDKTRPNW